MKLSDNDIISNLKIITEILSPIVIIIIALFTWNVYKMQLDYTVKSDYPVFKIDVVNEYADNQDLESMDMHLKIENTGKPVRAEIETYAIGILELYRDNHRQEINILLDGLLDIKGDTINNGTKVQGLISDRSTNFGYLKYQSAVYNCRVDLNNELKYVSYQVYSDVIFPIKIKYSNYKNEDVTTYYLVGRFNNIEITEKEYNKWTDRDHLKIIDMSEDQSIIKDKIKKIIYKS